VCGGFAETICQGTYKLEKNRVVVSSAKSIQSQERVSGIRKGANGREVEKANGAGRGKSVGNMRVNRKKTETKVPSDGQG